MGEYDDLIPVQEIDRKTGAPKNVRTAVGGAAGKDRLAQIRRFYPDAEPLMGAEGKPTDNFTFKSPKTGKLTVYNPPGLDIGDLFSLPRESAETAGGAVGGTLALPAALAGGPLTLALEPVGVGLGAAAGGQLFDIFKRLLPDTADTTTPVENFQKAGEDIAYNTAGAMGGAAVGKALSNVKETPRVLGNVMRSALSNKNNSSLGGTSERLADLTAAGVTPQPALVSDRRILSGVANAASNMPMGSGVMQSAGQRTLTEMQDAANLLAQKYANASTGGAISEAAVPMTSKEVAGIQLRSAARSAAERFKTQQDDLYKAAYDVLGGDTPVALINTSQLLANLKGLAEKAGAGNLPGAESVLKRAGKLVNADDAESAIASFTDDPRLQELIRKGMGSDSATTSYPLQILREIRTEIGKDLKSKVLVGSSGSANARLEQLYAAITQDIGEEVVKNPAGKELLGKADAFTKTGMQDIVPALERITNANLDGKAFDAAMDFARGGGQTLRVLRQQMKPEEFDVLAGTVLGRLGKSNPGAQSAAGDAFSATTFLSNWNKLSSEAKQTLFRGGQYESLAPQLDRLTRIAEMAKKMEYFANTSRTAGNIDYMKWLRGGQIVSLFLAPLSPTAAAINASSMVTPYLGAKLITSPTFAKWLADTSEKAVQQSFTPGMMSQAFGQLVAMAERDANLKTPVNQYKKAVEAQMKSPKETSPSGGSTASDEYDYLLPQTPTPGEYDDLIPVDNGNAQSPNQRP